MSDSYKQVSIAVCERVKNRIFLKKNFPLIFKRSLLTFVDRYEIQSFMNRTIIEDSQHPECPIRNILARISDKWSLLVIYTLDRSDKQAIRFKELQREIPDISQKMLTVTLRALEEDGYITRTVYPEVPPRVEYALTTRAHSLIPHINALIEWAVENKDAIISDRKRAAKKTALSSFV